MISDMAERTEKEIEWIKLRKRIVKRFHKGCEEYGLLEDGDHILIGLSGGKDSLALVELLGEQAKVFVPRIRVTAVHVSVENIGYKSDMDYLRSFCAQHGVELIHHVTRFDETTDYRKTHCFLCSWYRRKALFEVAKEIGCNKIALGHHKDDIVETLLMNLIFQGAFGTIAPKLQMDKFDMQMIRPLCLLEEKDLARYAELTGYRKQQKQCPYEHESHRADVKQLVTQLEAMNPNVRDSIWGAMHNVQEGYLPKKASKIKRRMTHV